MCKILQQAESHFIDFQSLHLAMITLQHDPYDICSETTYIIRCWSVLRFSQEDYSVKSILPFREQILTRSYVLNIC